MLKDVKNGIKTKFKVKEECRQNLKIKYITANEVTYQYRFSIILLLVPTLNASGFG